MAQRDPTAVAQKWSNNLSNAGPTITNGVNAVQTAPGQLAAQAVQTMRTRILAAIDSGKWAQNVSAVSLQSWKNSMLQTGLGRISDGARKGQPKMQTFMQQFLPYVARIQQEVKAMPNATLADRTNRMIFNMQQMSQFRYAHQ